MLYCSKYLKCLKFAELHNSENDLKYASVEVCSLSLIRPTVILSVVATEACDDDGLPHTLEHLIFLGSEDYPFKAVFLFLKLWAIVYFQL